MDQTNCVLMLNLPPGALGGIDLLSFTTTDRFHGVKNIPAGWHFVFAASNASLSIRHGAWFHVPSIPSTPQILIKKWDSQSEDFIAETSEPELLRWKANLGTIWKEGLTPYRQSVDKDSDGEAKEESLDWGTLTSHLTPALLSRLTGESKDHWSLTSASSAAQDLEDIPGLVKNTGFEHAEKELRFLPINLKRTWREGATGRERTEAARDRSWALGELVEHHCTGSTVREREAQILGELQFCFLMVLTLNNNSCLEQWKRVLTLLFTCREAVRERTWLFLDALKLLAVQLDHCKDSEGSLFDVKEDGGGFLKPLLQKFRKGLEEFGEGEWKVDVMDEIDEFQDRVKEEYGWELDDSFVKRGMLELEDGEQVEMDVGGVDEDEETGEYAPMVVELTADQLRELDGAVNGEVDDEAIMGDEAEDVDEMDMRF